MSVCVCVCVFFFNEHVFNEWFFFFTCFSLLNFISLISLPLQNVVLSLVSFGSSLLPRGEGEGGGRCASFTDFVLLLGFVRMRISFRSFVCLHDEVVREEILLLLLLLLPPPPLSLSLEESIFENYLLRSLWSFYLNSEHSSPFSLFVKVWTAC